MIGTVPEPGRDPKVCVPNHYIPILPNLQGKERQGATEASWAEFRGNGGGSEKETSSSGVGRGQHGFGIPGRGASLCLVLREHVGGGGKAAFEAGEWAGVGHRGCHGPA